MKNTNNIKENTMRYKTYNLPNDLKYLNNKDRLKLYQEIKAVLKLDILPESKMAIKKVLRQFFN